MWGIGEDSTVMAMSGGDDGQRDGWVGVYMGGYRILEMGGGGRGGPGKCQLLKCGAFHICEQRFLFFLKFRVPKKPPSLPCPPLDPPGAREKEGEKAGEVMYIGGEDKGQYEHDGLREGG